MGATRADGGSNCRWKGGLWGENERAWGLPTGREGLSHERRRVADPDGKGEGRKERTDCGVKKNGGLREGEESIGNSHRVQSHRARLSSSASHPVPGPPPRLSPCSRSHLERLLFAPLRPYLRLYKLLHMSLLAQYAIFLRLQNQLAVIATS